VTAHKFFGLTLALSVLASCGQRDEILPGERFDLRETPAFVNQSLPVNIPAAQANLDWTHRNGDADHAIAHPALGSALSEVYAVSIGEGDSRRARITADPVVAAGVIYTLDARATVTATSQSGTALWARTLSAGSDGLSDASGGGITVSGGQVYVSTGFGTVTALDAATGAVRWVQDLDAPVAAPATVRGDLVYVVARNSVALALDAATGRIRWQITGNPSVANVAGGASAAVTNEIAVLPFASGEVVGTFPQGGLRRWSVAVTGSRLGQASATITDIASDPVIVGNRVYVGNFGGRVVALDLTSGDRVWTAAEGAQSPVWPAGNALFLVNDVNQLVRLDAANGQPVWRIGLPDLERTRDARRKEVVGHYGPILAGGRLIVASTDGFIRQYDPTSGALVGSIAIAGGAASLPVVAGETLYVVSKDGQLHAFR